MYISKAEDMVTKCITWNRYVVLIACQSMYVATQFAHYHRYVHCKVTREQMNFLYMQESGVVQYHRLHFHTAIRD